MKLSKNNEKKISDFFKNKPEIAAVYLYGSYAKSIGECSKSTTSTSLFSSLLKSYKYLVCGISKPLNDFLSLTKTAMSISESLRAVFFAYEPYKYTAAISGLFLKKSLIFFSLFLLSFMILNYNRWKLFLQKYKTKPFF